MQSTKKELYKRIYAELFEILNTLKGEEIERIPKSVRMNIIDNMAPSCDFKYDKNKKLQDQDVLPQTKALLIEIYTKYLVETPDEKEAWDIVKKDFLNKMNESRKEEYDSSKVFKRHIESGIPIIEDYEEIEVPVNTKKESIFNKLFKKKK